MESVGQKLRASRLQIGLTLEDISAKTRISVRNLQAIENDDDSPFKSAFFYRSFVRQFARQLNIDFEDLAAAVEAVTSKIPEPLMPGQAERSSVLPKVPALRPSLSTKVRWLHSFTSLILMLVACSTLYAVWQNSRPTIQAAVAGLIHSLPRHSATALTQFIPNGE